MQSSSSKLPASAADGATGARSDGSGDAKAPKVVVTVTAASPVAAAAAGGGAGAAPGAAATGAGGDDDTLPAPMTPLVRIDSVAKRAVSEVAKRMPRPLVVCGPSGVGKGTLVGRLLKDFPSHFGKSVSHTTRKPRPGEVNGTSYHFVTLEDIKQGIADHKFVENAVYAGNHYGTSVASVQAVAHTGRICILEIDIQGAETIRARSLTDADFIQPNYLFILPPDLSALVTRLQVRGTETDDTLLLRMETARDELLKLSTTVTYFQNKIVNHDLQHAFTAFCLSLCDCYPHLKEAIDTAALLAAAEAAPAAAAKPLTAEQAAAHVQRLLSDSQHQIDALKRTRAANAAVKAAAAAAGAAAAAAGGAAPAAAAAAPAHAGAAAAAARTPSNGVAAAAGAGAKPSAK